MVVRVLVDDGRNEEGAKEFTCHVLGEGYPGVLGKSWKSGPVRSMGIRKDGDGRKTADGKQVSGVDYVFNRQEALLSGGERKRGRSVEKAIEDWNVGLTAHELLRGARGIRETLRARAENVGPGGWRYGHSSRRRRTYRGKSGTAIAPLPLILSDSLAGSSARDGVSGDGLLNWRLLRPGRLGRLRRVRQIRRQSLLLPKQNLPSH